MKKVTGTINAKRKMGKINKEIYGHFSEHLGRCIYEGIFVGEDSEIPNTKGMRNDVIEALKELEIPVLRWPGGCFADEYHWMDGIGEKENRKRMINTHWGGVVEDNSFGTHEFFELCDQLGCEPYINGNVGSGSVREMSEWIEYMTFDGESPMSKLRQKNGRKEPWKLKYFGVGNENWGCGGNMTPDYYANIYRRYQTYCRNYGDNKLYKIACGPDGANYEWTDKLMSIIGDRFADAISLHYYTVPCGWEPKSKATQFDAEVYYETIDLTLRMEEMIDRHLEIMSKYDPEHKVKLIVDEWGTWFQVEEGTNPGFLYQQNTMRDAITAAFNFDIFIRHSDRIVMANIAQAVNVLQSVILTEGEKMVRTPTYFVFDMYRRHMEGDRLFVSGDASDKNGVPTLSYSASVKDETVFLTMTNASLTDEEELEVSFGDFVPSKIKAEILTTDDIHEHNTFDGGETVVPKKFEGYAFNGNKLRVKLPKNSVAAFTVI